MNNNNAKKSARTKGAQISGLTVLAAAITLQAASAADWPTEQIGQGAVSLERVGSQIFNWVQGDRADRSPPQNPYVTSDFNSPIPSNDWASSLIVDQYSKALHAHPLSFKASAQGFEVAMPPEVIGPVDDMGETSVRRNHNGNVDLVVNGTRLTANDARLRSTGDWTYDIVMADSDAEMDITIGHGLPFAYFTFSGTDAVINLARNASVKEVVYQQGSAALIRVLDPVDNEFNYYGVFYPNVANFTHSSNQLSIDFPTDAGYMSVAGLPDGSTETWNQFRAVAYNFVTDTRVDWQYDENNAEVITQYRVTTDNKPESTSTGSVLALLPHQWRHSTTVANAPSYDSVRGEMKTIVGNGFTTVMPFHGILPQLPMPETAESVGMLTKHLTDYYGYGYSLEPQFIQPGVDGGNTGYDTYWMGKNLNRLSGLVAISDALDDNNPELLDITTTMVDALKAQLEFWFDGNKNREDNYFYYDQNWGTLVGYPSSYDTDTDLNDHHFHYGYWINAAAQIAMRDAQWAEDSHWGGMVKELISDIATADRDSNRYPFLRNFDVYEGHSWASGTVPYVEDGYYPEGNNNEASSEGINAWAGLILWGEATGDKTIRDLGIYLYSHEVEAANTYWFNLYGDVGHPDYPNEEISRVWGGGYDHTTWWTEDPIQTHGINMLPITGASLYLGKDPEFVQRNYDAIWTEYANWDGDNGLFNKEQVKVRWQDIVNEYLAFADVDAAIANWKDKNISDDPINGVDPALGIEFGESRAHTYQHLQMLKQFGQPDFSIRPIDHTLGAVFNNNGVKTYVGYNPTDSVKTLKFSDAMGLVDVPPKSFAQGSGEPVIIVRTDSDNDGIYDSVDQCENTPEGETVNDAGCPDSDRDSVFDNLDVCPATPTGAEVNTVGCPDSDNDGVFDNVDQCPNTEQLNPPVPVTSTGCADRDQDSVPDTDDLCPNTPLGQAVDADGCAVYDDDNDGVINSQDLCPNTPAGNPVNAQGCTDTDQDGVADTADLCPASVEGSTVNEQGCGDDDNDGVANNLDACPNTTPGTVVTANGCPVLPYGLESNDNGNAVLYLNSRDWADAHYRINNGAQQNVRMVQTGSRNERALSGLQDGDTVSVYFTYLNDDCACVKDTATANFTYQSGPVLDDDNDGVPNSKDLCPDTPVGATVDTNGCEIIVIGDDDGDGVNNDNDLCPNTTPGAVVDAKGCEVIGTTWGVTDLSDDQVTVYLTTTDWADIHFLVNNGAQQNVRMIQTGSRNEWTINGLVNGDTIRFWFTYLDPDCGCVKDSVQVETIVGGDPLPDSDNDGVDDTQDQCPNTPAGDTVDNVGCTVEPPLDSDNDGVIDNEDLCPNTPAGTTVDANGCAVSTEDPFGAVIENSSQVLIYANTSAWADVHYWRNGGAQQNVRMIQTGTRNEYRITGLASGDTVVYNITYWDTACNCAKDSTTLTVLMP